MRSKLITLFCILFISSYLAGQQKPYKDFHIRKYNIGISNGFGGMHFFLRPVLEIKMGRLSVRGAVGFFNIGGDISYEIKKANWELLKKFYHCEANYWTISTSYNYMYRPFGETLHGHSFDEFYSITYGIKTYGYSRLTTSFKIGFLLNHHIYSSDEAIFYDIPPDHSYNIFPYADFSVLLYLVKNPRIDDKSKEIIEKYMTEKKPLIFGFQVEEQINYPFNNVGICFVMQASKHEYYLGPEHVTFFPKYQKLYHELYTLSPLGISMGYQYTFSGKSELFNCMLRIKYSLCKMWQLKDPDSGYSIYRSIQLMQLTAGTGVRYALNSNLACYGILGLLSLERSYPINNAYSPNLLVGVKYIF